MKLNGTVSFVTDLGFAVLRCDLVDERADSSQDGFLRAVGGLSEQVLELSDDWFDWIEVE
jgi:hypothetical protein